MKTDIRNIDDIKIFVDEFYHKIQLDDLLGPIFNNTITDWPTHLDKMYKFWNAALFGVPGFKGNPFARHAPLPINKVHFEQWIKLFHETINKNFEGDIANDCKYRAELMASMFQSRLELMKGNPNKVIV
ncbi:group III truncated hemoglobin [Pseudopedobacter beijingensis]|uniref:Group III truncated hemoglobin n=1 Tax=Pseudopedobacter beijingensis TaxID=1207056 RepID=A0ABW4IBU8_9SPHI